MPDCIWMEKSLLIFLFLTEKKIFNLAWNVIVWKGWELKIFGYKLGYMWRLGIWNSLYWDLGLVSGLNSFLEKRIFIRLKRSYQILAAYWICAIDSYLHFWSGWNRLNPYCTYLNLGGSTYEVLTFNSLVNASFGSGKKPC